MRRSLLSLVGLAALSALSMSLAACGRTDDSSGIPSRAPKSSGGGAAAANGSSDDPGAALPYAPACSGIADAKQIATDADAGDLRIADGAVFYRAGTKVMRAAKDGSGNVAVYTSPSLVRSFVTDTGLIATIEDPNQATAVVKIISQDDPSAANDPAGKGLLLGALGEIATNWNAGGSYFIGADADAFYAVGDEEQGEVIYAISRTLPGLRALATVTDVISSAQLADGALWYVRDRSRVFTIPLSTPDPNDPNQKGAAGEPKEVFGISANACALAVGSNAAFCSEGSLIERRDLSGANPQTLFEATKSKVSSPFGGATWSDGSLYVRASAPDAAMKHALRALKPGANGVEERIVACGRSAIGEVAVDKDSVVWTEPGKGVFMAPR